jgi:teichuronic acid biosynthesis glycosyltransferase TuaC
MRARVTDVSGGCQIISLPVNGPDPPSLRVLAVTNMWPHAARPMLGIYAERQMRSLTRHGMAVDVLPIAGSENALASLGAYARAAREVVRLNRGPRRYDVIHAHTGHCGVLACLQARYPVVMSYVGYDLDVPAEDREGVRTRAERVLFRNLSRWFAATIAKSERGAGKLPPAGRARNSVVPNGVDRDLFAPSDRDGARAALGWPLDGAPVVLFLADPRRFTKRFALAEEAVARARERLPDLRLRVCDDVPPALVPQVMNAADVLLLTSVAEGSPNVVKEALACNLPVVSVDVGDVREQLTGVRHCHVCSDDPADLAAALLSVIEAVPERSDGRERSEHLGLDPIAVRLRAIYEDASRRGPALFGGSSRNGTGARDGGSSRNGAAARDGERNAVG